MRKHSELEQDYPQQLKHVLHPIDGVTYYTN